MKTLCRLSAFAALILTSSCAWIAENPLRSFDLAEDAIQARLDQAPPAEAKKLQDQLGALQAYRCAVTNSAELVEHLATQGVSMPPDPAVVSEAIYCLSMLDEYSNTRRTRP